MGGRDREVTSWAVGPISLDVEMAKRLGWDIATVEYAKSAIILVSRGAGVSARFIDGSMCEMCGYAKQLHSCAGCRVKTRPTLVELSDDLGAALGGELVSGDEHTFEPNPPSAAGNLLCRHCGMGAQDVRHR